MRHLQIIPAQTIAIYANLGAIHLHRVPSIIKMVLAHNVSLILGWKLLKRLQTEVRHIIVVRRYATNVIFLSVQVKKQIAPSYMFADTVIT